MSILISEVLVGGICKTTNNQERKVTKIENGKVYYDSRGGNVKNEWSGGHTLATPPTIEKFVNDIESKIGQE